MTKNEFVKQLESKLQDISRSGKEEAISFYKELIEDAIEDGKEETEVVKELGSIDDIVQKILEDNDSKKKEVIYKKSSKIATGKSILLIILSPFLITLFLISFILILALYILIISVYIVAFALLIVSLPYFIDFFINLFKNPNFAILELGISLLSTGLAIVCLKGVRKLFELVTHFTKEGYQTFLAIIKGEQL